MPKINPLQNFNKDETDLRHLQVVYLNDQNFSFEEISKWTGYAVSTIKGYIKKFIHQKKGSKKKSLITDSTIFQ